MGKVIELRPASPIYASVDESAVRQELRHYLSGVFQTLAHQPSDGEMEMCIAITSNALQTMRSLQLTLRMQREAKRNSVWTSELRKWADILHRGFDGDKIL